MTKLFECYVAKPTHDEAVEIVERLITNGARAFDAVYGMGVCGKEYFHEKYNCWGYNQEHGTYVGDSDFNWAKRSKQLTMPEFRNAFPCDKYDEVVENTEEWPKPSDKVVVDCNGDWEAIFIGKSTAGAYVCQMPKGYQHGIYDGFLKGDLSKPKSEREKFVESAVKAFNSGCMPDYSGQPFIDGIEALYDAGFKAPEEK